MSDEPGTETSVRESAPPPDPASVAALERYRQRQRRPRLVYAGIVTVIVLLLGVVTVVAWSSGETNNSTLRTVADPPDDLPLAAPAANPLATWRQSGQAAIGAPQWRGTVVTYRRHTVQGVDARTGKTTWSYTRSDRTVCTAAQLGGTTIAIFALRGNCDQVAGLDSQTGERRWSRTLDMDGMPVTGNASYLTTQQSGSDTLFVRTSSVIYALDPVSGYNRWTYTRYGCTITGLAHGMTGALISQNCSKRVRCAEQTFCKPGPQLLLRTPYDSRDDKDVKNPDKITWNLIGSDATPVSAGSLVSALADGTLLQLDARKGTTVARTPLAAVPGPSSIIRTTDASGTEIVSIGATTYALRSGTATPVWTRGATGPATVTSATPDSAPVLGSARITVPTADGAAILNGSTGRITEGVSLTGSPGGLVYPLGQGFLVAGRTTVAAFS